MSVRRKSEIFRRKSEQGFTHTLLTLRFCRIRKVHGPRPKGTLQVKILSGYLLLTLLVGGIVYAVWYEKRVFQQAEEEERAMLGQRKLTNETFKSLIALLLYSDGALLWDKDDLRSYEEKDRRMSEILDSPSGGDALDGQPHGQPAQRAAAPAGTVRLGAGPCGQRTGAGKRKKKQEKFLELVQAQEEKGKGRK